MFRGIAAKQGIGGVMNIGKSKAKVYAERRTGLTYDDMAALMRTRMGNTLMAWAAAVMVFSCSQRSLRYPPE